MKLIAAASLFAIASATPFFKRAKVTAGASTSDSYPPTGSKSLSLTPVRFQAMSRLIHSQPPSTPISSPRRASSATLVLHQLALNLSPSPQPLHTLPMINSSLSLHRPYQATLQPASISSRTGVTSPLGTPSTLPSTVFPRPHPSSQQG